MSVTLSNFGPRSVAKKKKKNCWNRAKVTLSGGKIWFEYGLQIVFVSGSGIYLGGS